ncbi:MAG: hypothetical protein ACYTG0_09995 [Planctomycetota bacterium]|jgi:hypothetical protein
MVFPFPKLPWHDRRFWRRVFRLRGGPMPAAMVLAALANVFLLLMLDRAVGAALFTTLWLGTVAFLGVVGGVALLGAATYAVRALYRLGVRGWSRPRWWFEVSSLAWTLCVLLILAVALSVPGAKIPALGGWLDATFFAARNIIVILLCVFFVSAIVGYVVSMISGRARCGNAYECIQMIFAWVGGVGLLIVACSQWWPPRRAWPDGVFLAVCGAIGVALLVGGFRQVSSDPRVRRPRWLR